MSSEQRPQWSRRWHLARQPGTQPAEGDAALRERVAALEREVEDLKVGLFEAQSFMPRLSALVDYVSNEMGAPPPGHDSDQTDDS